MPQASVCASIGCMFNLCIVLVCVVMWMWCAYELGLYNLYSLKKKTMHADNPYKQSGINTNEEFSAHIVSFPAMFYYVKHCINLNEIRTFQKRIKGN
jgi:hypothetical protein